nr:expressed protein [Hymenolepis microstoma]
MRESVQSRKLETEMESKTPSETANQRIDGRTSDLYELQPSNTERDYFSNLPKLAIKEIINYLDDESLVACSQVSPKWNAIIKYTDRLKTFCCSSPNPKRRCIEREDSHGWSPWTNERGQSKHT